MGARMMKMRVLACVCVMAISLTCLSALDEEAGHQKDFNEVTEVPTTEFRLRGVPLAKAIPKAVHPLSPKKPLLTASAHVHKSAHKVNKALQSLAQAARESLAQSQETSQAAWSRGSQKAPQAPC